MNKKKKILIIAIVTVLLIPVILTASGFAILEYKEKITDDDFSEYIDSDKYSEPVYVDGIEVITQDVSCGYAVLEMFSAWNGGDLTEEKLYEEYGRVVTSTGEAFCDEMNKQFPDYTTVMYKYLKNTELIDLTYDSLSEGMPVPVEWAAKKDEEWTLHYSLVTGMDIPNDTVTVANPYGYLENVSVDEFISRTRFDAYENMPLFLRMGFVFGVFEKNSIFIVKEK
ncbi:MAG: hypothetical protein J5515_05595, partial [Lachnospiraceae bacterium]|nr:hypothetical protein [Lachnospiraceae bacterium]